MSFDFVRMWGGGVSWPFGSTCSRHRDWGRWGLGPAALGARRLGAVRDLQSADTQLVLLSVMSVPHCQSRGEAADDTWTLLSLSSTWPNIKLWYSQRIGSNQCCPRWYRTNLRSPQLLNIIDNQALTANYVTFYFTISTIHDVMGFMYPAHSRLGHPSLPIPTNVRITTTTRHSSVGHVTNRRYLWEGSMKRLQSITSFDFERMRTEEFCSTSFVITTASHLWQLHSARHYSDLVQLPRWIFCRVHIDFWYLHRDFVH